MNSLKASLLVIAYNSASYLDRCLSSILSQDGASFEVIIVLDPSSDGSESLALSYKEKDDRVKVIINEKRLGLGLSRLRAMEEAEGEYFSFVDADDYLAPNYLKTLIDTMDSSGADICNCSYYHIKKGNKITRDGWGRNRTLPHDKAIQAYLYDAYIRGFLWNKMYRREKILDDESLMFTVYQDYPFEDIGLNLSFFQKANKVISIKDPLYYYDESNVGSTTHSLRPVRAQRHLFVWGLLRYYLEHVKDAKGVKAWFKANKRYLLSLWFDLHLDKKHGANKDYIKEVKKDFKYLRKNKAPLKEHWGYPKVEMAEASIIKIKKK